MAQTSISPEEIPALITDWVTTLGFVDARPTDRVSETEYLVTGYFHCPEEPRIGLQPLCPDGVAGIPVPHTLLVNPLTFQVIITTFGKNHPLGPWLIDFPKENEEPYAVADPALPAQCKWPGA